MSDNSEFVDLSVPRKRSRDRGDPEELQPQAMPAIAPAPLDPNIPVIDVDDSGFAEKLESLAAEFDGLHTIGQAAATFAITPRSYSTVKSVMDSRGIKAFYFDKDGNKATETTVGPISMLLRHGGKVRFELIQGSISTYMAARDRPDMTVWSFMSKEVGQRVCAELKQCGAYVLPIERVVGHDESGMHTVRFGMNKNALEKAAAAAGVTSYFSKVVLTKEEENETNITRTLPEWLRGFFVRYLRDFLQLPLTSRTVRLPVPDDAGISMVQVKEISNHFKVRYESFFEKGRVVTFLRKSVRAACDAVARSRDIDLELMIEERFLPFEISEFTKIPAYTYGREEDELMHIRSHSHEVPSLLSKGYTLMCAPGGFRAVLNFDEIQEMKKLAESLKRTRGEGKGYIRMRISSDCLDDANLQLRREKFDGVVEAVILNSGDREIAIRYAPMFKAMDRPALRPETRSFEGTRPYDDVPAPRGRIFNKNPLDLYEDIAPAQTSLPSGWTCRYFPDVRCQFVIFDHMKRKAYRADTGEAMSSFQNGMLAGLSQVRSKVEVSIGGSHAQSYYPQPGRDIAPSGYVSFDTDARAPIASDRSGRSAGYYDVL